MNHKSYRWILSLLVCALLVTIATSCSEKVVNEAPMDGDLVIDIQLSPSGIEAAVEVYRLTVTGDDMDPVTADFTRVVNGHFVVGQIEVPVGTRRLFVLEGLRGIADGTPEVLYRGQTVTSVQPGVVTTLSIALVPVAPMVKLSPTYSEVFSGNPLELDFRIFNLPGVNSIRADLQFSELNLANPLITYPGDLPEGSYFNSYQEGNYIGFTIADTVGGTIVDGRGNGREAHISLQPLVEVGLLPASAEVWYQWLEITTLEGDTLGLGDLFNENAQALIFPILDRIVFFPDVALDRIIRDLDTSIGSTDPIMLSDIIQTTGLSFYEVGVADLTGLGAMINLSYLGMSYNSIPNISELAYLQNLASLDADYCGISDITPLTNLTRLEYVHLGYNSITDISVLAGKVNMRALYLENNQIVDLAPLRGLTNLYTLDLHGNQITDILPLVENPGLGWYDYVYLYDNPSLANNPTQLEYVEVLRTRGVTVDMIGPR